MQSNFYALAHEQAENERAEIRTQIEQLLARDAKLEKLVNTLKEVISFDEPAAQPVAEEVHTDGQAAEHRDGAHWEEHHNESPENQGS
jgi:hypothetical protein